MIEQFGNHQNHDSTLCVDKFGKGDLRRTDKCGCQVIDHLHVAQEKQLPVNVLVLRMMVNSKLIIWTM